MAIDGPGVEPIVGCRVDHGPIVERWARHDPSGRMQEMDPLPPELEHVMER